MTHAGLRHHFGDLRADFCANHRFGRVGGRAGHFDDHGAIASESPSCPASRSPVATHVLRTACPLAAQLFYMLFDMLIACDRR